MRTFPAVYGLKTLMDLPWNIIAIKQTENNDEDKKRFSYGATHEQQNESQMPNVICWQHGHYILL